jgi:flagellar hook assembly protein FlgD
MLIPDETALLPNYPNPFNPETWIPYHLANPSNVQITIYDTRGTIVRQLDLGHQPQGYYTSQSRAAYWDGRNTVGERVASGIYFYTLTAGDFTATRKLLIRK